MNTMVSEINGIHREGQIKFESSNWHRLIEEDKQHIARKFTRFWLYHALICLVFCRFYIFQNYITGPGAILLFLYYQRGYPSEYKSYDTENKNVNTTHKNAYISSGMCCGCSIGISSMAYLTSSRETSRMYHVIKVMWFPSAWPFIFLCTTVTSW